MQTVAEVSGLIDTLKQPGHYTLFAPTNAAFDKVGGDVMERLMSDKNVLKGETDKPDTYDFFRPFIILLQ